jgi:HEAT repeat protein
MKSRKLRWTLIVVGLVVALVAFVLGPYELIRAWKIERDLKAVGPADAARAPEIASLLDYYNPMVRGTAAQALGRIGRSAKGFTPALLRALQDADAQVRRDAAWGLGHIDAGAAAIQPLTEALDDRDAEVRRYAALALMLHGPLAEPAVPKLIERLDDDEAMAYMAARALAAIGPAAKGSVPHLITALRGDTTLRRLDYAAALAKFGPDARDAVPDLRRLAQDPDAEIRKGAAAALRSIDPGAAPP